MYFPMEVGDHGRCQRDASLQCQKRCWSTGIEPAAAPRICVVFVIARRFDRDRDRAYFKTRHNIGLWFWELENFPPAGMVASNIRGGSQHLLGQRNNPILDKILGQALKKGYVDGFVKTIPAVLPICKSTHRSWWS
jgi:hypothetical protein